MCIDKVKYLSSYCISSYLFILFYFYFVLYYENFPITVICKHNCNGCILVHAVIYFCIFSFLQFLSFVNSIKAVILTCPCLPLVISLGQVSRNRVTGSKDRLYIYKTFLLFVCVCVCLT